MAVSQHDAAENRPPLYVLAGGRSSRFGRDKALAEHRGMPLLRSVAKSFSPVVSSTTAVADRIDRYAELGLRTIVDRRDNAGPLAGLEAAMMDCLQQTDAGWLVLACCDLIDPSPAWLADLWSKRTPQAQAVAFRATHWEPMPALYHTSLLPRVREHLDRGERSMQRLLDRGGAVAAAMPDGLNELPQANTPEQFLRFASRSKEPA